MTGAEPKYDGRMLADLPTPLERADRLGRALGMPPGRLWLKRDDCTGLATGGNKARKLALIVPDALASGCDVLVTGGGLQSNHARMTAAAAAASGLGCMLVFGAERPLRSEGNQLLDRVLGAECRYAGPMPLEDLDAAIVDVAEELRASGRRAFVVPVGGSSPLGASAYSDASGEIVEQLGHEDVLVVTATGSGGTQAGLAARLGHARVLGVDVGAVSHPAGAVRELALAVAARQRLPPPTGDPWLVRDQIGAGYGARTDAAREAIRLVARTEGVILDPVYSAKAFAGLMRLDPTELRARAVVFLVTGGAPALFTEQFAGWLAE